MVEPKQLAMLVFTDFLSLEKDAVEAQQQRVSEYDGTQHQLECRYL